jgi:guanylate kinase
MPSKLERGVLLVLSGPSGAGKSTAMARFLEKHPDTLFSVSVTTRKPREGEVDGKHYHFISRGEFEVLIEKGKLLEWAQYVENFYGTPVEPILEALRDGKVIVLEIEVKGALQVKERCPGAVLAFLTPSSMEEVERRLRKRGTDSEETVRKRMLAAAEEYKSISEYKYIVTNDTVEEAVSQLEAIVTAERCLIKPAGAPERSVGEGL